VVAPAHVRRIAPAADQADATARLYQALYGCTMHPAGLLHAIGAILEAEAEGRFTLAQVAAAVADQADHALVRDGADAWRHHVMVELCQRLAGTSPS
jgi:hypothetical protein